MRKTSLSDELLIKAVWEIDNGIIDAELGGNLLKKRIALPGSGKSGGARTIIATRFSGGWCFLYGFNKNERSNISKAELRVLQEVAADLLEFQPEAIEIALAKRELIEVINNDS